MKHFLLLMTAALAVSASAQVKQTAPQKAVSSEFITTSPTIKAPQATAVLQTLKSGAMGQLQLVRTADGRVAKQIVTSAGKTYLSVPRAKAPAAQGNLNENFGGWDGVTTNWIPEDWSEINSEDSIVMTYPGSFTWAVDNNSTGFLAKPVNGDYICSIYFAIDYETYAYGHQDEWLISPMVTIEQGQQLEVSLSYAPIFMYDLTEWVDWNTLEFLDHVRTASVQVMIREAGAEEWTMIQDYYDLYSDMSFAELLDSGTDNGWRTYKYPLDAYAGKDVQVAFRYEGVNGDSWAIDYVSIDQPRPEACYQRPQGAFYWGYSDEYSSLQSGGKGFMLMPGDIDVTWTNTSNDDANFFTWTYFDPVTDEILTSNERDLTLNYPMNPESYNWYNIPELAAYASEGASPANYSWYGYALQAGGYAHYTFSGDTEESLYGVGNYDPQNMFSSLSFATQTPLWGISEGTNAGWSSLLNKEVELTAIGNYFEKPLVPYTLKGVHILSGGAVPADAELTISVKKVIGGYLADEIATATCHGSDVMAVMEGYLSLPFQLDNIEIDEAILVMLDLKGATGIDLLTPWHSYYADPQGETNGYFTLDVNGQEELHALNYIQSSNGPCYCSFLFNLDMSYPTAESVVALEAIDQNEVGSTECFNMAGQRISAQHGFCIERQANGLVRKVMK